MTQEQLAQRLGIGKAALSMIETGKSGLSSRNKNILIQDLNVNPDWLENGKGNMFNADPALNSFRLRTDNTLPTSGTARFFSPLSVDDFVKKMQYTYYTKEAFDRVAREVA